jgi:hypothetical protein
VAAYVVPTDEETMIARHVLAVLNQSGPAPASVGSFGPAGPPG